MKKNTPIEIHIQKHYLKRFIHGFSLNGTTRNQGYIGQTSLSRTLVRTLRNGTAVRGHGGCCTDASKAPVLQAEFTNLEDNSVVKKLTQALWQH